jgi:hypothetical protein
LRETAAGLSLSSLAYSRIRLSRKQEHMAEMRLIIRPMAVARPAGWNVDARDRRRLSRWRVERPRHDVIQRGGVIAAT